MLEHGGNLRRASEQFGIPTERWLDLSTGINPAGYPVAAPSPRAWRRLPEEDDGLIAAACAYYGTDARALLAVAGSQAAIRALPRLRGQSRVVMADRTFNEYEAAWGKHGHDVRTTAAEALPGALEEADVLIVCNPNNPTCDRYAPERLLEWHASLAARGGWLIVDEAFVDATPELSVASRAGAPGLIVLRSLGKFFGLAGARVGFVCAAPELLAALAEELGPWTVSAPAQCAARQALADRPWQAGMRKALATASAKLQRLLARHGIRGPGTALFRWWRSPQAAELHRALAQQGVLLRLFPGSVRIGLPGLEEEWQRLAAALETWGGR